MQIFVSVTGPYEESDENNLNDFPPDQQSAASCRNSKPLKYLENRSDNKVSVLESI